MNSYQISSFTIPRKGSVFIDSQTNSYLPILASSRDSDMSDSLFLDKQQLLKSLSTTSIDVSDLNKFICSIESDKTYNFVHRNDDINLESKINGTWKLMYSNVSPKVNDKIQVFQVIKFQQLIVQHILKFSNELNIVLDHDLKISSMKSPLQLCITWKSIKLNNFLAFPILSPPLLDLLRSTCFDVTYLDDDLRISRGLNNEIRVFVRDNNSK